MQIVFAECSASYSGRGETTLERGLRAIIVKSDGSVAIHNDSSNKPLNYMKLASVEKTINELGEQVWTFDSRHESLRIVLHRLVGLTEQQLETKESEPGGQVAGTEAQLQEWLFTHPEFFGEGYQALQREFPTGRGNVDLLLLTPQSTPLAVEVKISREPRGSSPPWT